MRKHILAVFAGWLFLFITAHCATAQKSDSAFDDLLQVDDPNLIGQVIDADTGQLLACRLYVQHVQSGRFYFASSSDANGSAVMYDKQLRATTSIERHTTLSAHGFQLRLPSGEYRIVALHGKEFLPAQTHVTVGNSQENVKLRLRRFADMAERGWYSGDTHVHRTMEELPNAILAEDLNVALPLNYWVRDSRDVPSASSHANLIAKPMYVDANHLIYPINTEYEIFTVDGKRHTQGAVFVLGHKTPLDLTAPPVAKIAEAARAQGALLDLDKHSWNWSMMIVPQMKVDLFELSNNHHWRTEFGFPRWTVENAPPSWPEIEKDETGFTEKGWTEFGMQTYYALLNCGFRMRVTAGTASGVHPVPLGHGRVYVHIDGQFTYEAWMENLNAGHSFVTQGPLMNVQFDGQLPGTTWSTDDATRSVKVSGTIDSVRPLTAVELIRNGEVIENLNGTSRKTKAGCNRFEFETEVEVNGTGWLAVRCFERPQRESPEGKVIFAHTNPVFIDVTSKPLLPRRRDVEYFVQRMETEIKRNEGTLSEEAIAEYREAKSIYEALLQVSQ